MPPGFILRFILQHATPLQLVVAIRNPISDKLSLSNAFTKADAGIPLNLISRSLSRSCSVVLVVAFVSDLSISSEY